jgi:hypothetical protein
MATVWVTVWRGGNASGQKLSIDGEALGPCIPAPAEPEYAHGGFYSMMKLALGQHTISYKAKTPGDRFWFAVVRQGPTVLLDEIFSLPPAVNGADTFQL